MDFMKYADIYDTCKYLRNNDFKRGKDMCYGFIQGLYVLSVLTVSQRHDLEAEFIRGEKRKR